MEKLFENKYTRDKEWAKDVYGYIYFCRPVTIVLYVLFAVYAMIGIYSSITSDNAAWYYILIPVIWCAVTVFLYNKKVNAVIKRDLALHGKTIEVTVTAAEDRIKLSQSTGAEYELNYCDIKRVVQTRKYIYLWSKTNMSYSFKKNSFSCGDANEFLLFLRSKGVKVK